MKKLKSLSLLIITIVAINAKAQPPSTGVLRPGIVPNNQHDSLRPIPYPHLREADVMWSKRVWRVIDLREKINHPLYYPTSPILDRKSLFDVIKDGITKGTIIAFGNPAMDDEFKLELTKSEVEAMLVKWDSTATAEDPLNPGTMISAPIKNVIGSEQVWKYWIKEDWFFDRQRSVLDVRIIGICPLIEKKTENGESTGADQALFWVYFPEARPILANQVVYMRHNDAERRTFDAIFWKRMFSSYIRKETNVYDRSIAEYQSGLDALLESDRVKDDIFKFEHDLWHF